MITVCSIFRNSAGYVDEYLSQMSALARHVDLRLVLTYGDCTDPTYSVLVGLGLKYGLNDRMEIDRFDHNGPNFGSVDHPERWNQIARVVRSTLDRVGDPGDALVWVESDLLWSPSTILTLVDDLQKVPAVAPCVYANNSDRFYDTWGFRQNGKLFMAHAPYRPDHQPLGEDLVKIDSCGSCWVTSGDAWKEWSGHWPYPAGGELWLDPAVQVWHP